MFRVQRHCADTVAGHAVHRTFDGQKMRLPHVVPSSSDCIDFHHLHDCIAARNLTPIKPVTDSGWSAMALRFLYGLHVCLSVSSELVTSDRTLARYIFMGGWTCRVLKGRIRYEVPNLGETLSENCLKDDLSVRKYCRIIGGSPCLLRWVEKKSA